MEKFGIFELLDALSAIVLDGEDAPPEQTPRPSDGAYAPPVYGVPPKSAPSETEEREQSAHKNTPAQKNAGEYAIEDFYRRHDSRAKK